MNLTLLVTPKAGFLTSRPIFDLISALCSYGYCTRETVIGCHSITKITYMYINSRKSTNYDSEMVRRTHLSAMQTRGKIKKDHGTRPRSAVSNLSGYRCMCLTANPGVGSLITARSHTFLEIDHEIISTVILLPSADAFKKGCCQLPVFFFGHFYSLNQYSGKGSLPKSQIKSLVTSESMCTNNW